MDADQFVVMALKLRESGAAKVRVGEMEVVWATPVPPPRQAIDPPTPKNRPVDKPLSPEEARLLLYRDELGLGDN